MASSGNVLRMQATEPVPDGGLSVGATIRVLRQSRGLSADELGRMIGKSGPLIRQIELGNRRAILPVCIEIARVLDVSLATIVGETLASIIESQPAQAAS